MRASRAPSLLPDALPAWALRAGLASRGVVCMTGVATGELVREEKAGAGNGKLTPAQG